MRSYVNISSPAIREYTSSAVAVSAGTDVAGRYMHVKIAQKTCGRALPYRKSLPQERRRKLSLTEPAYRRVAMQSIR
jgi:hypothetical protein